MNIVFFVSGMNKGGAERVISSLSNYYIQNNDNVSIIIIGNEDSSYFLDNRVYLIKMNFDFSILYKNSSLKNMILYIKKLKDIIPGDTEILVAFDCRLAVVAKIACSAKVKIIGSERGNPYITKKGLKKRLFVLMSNILDGFVFQTQGAMKFYPKLIQKKGIVIPNGVFIKPTNACFNNYNKRNNIICATGNLRAMKRHDLLINAFEYANKINPNFKLLIYGDGEKKDKILNMIKEKKLQDKILLLGQNDDISEVLSRSKIFVLASDYEGMPNGLIEAMACGCACIATDCDFGPRELIKNNENGILVSVGNETELGKAILLLMNDLHYAEMIAKNAEKINLTHSQKIIAEKYYSYFEYVLNK